MKKIWKKLYTLNENTVAILFILTLKKKPFQTPLYTELSIHKYHEAWSYSKEKKMGANWEFFESSEHKYLS